ncbi:hypothetical protein BM1_08806 [Bipolaris maydis]|nr:hypothetical protein BM1_08806 [Bipolaris maydis]
MESSSSLGAKVAIPRLKRPDRQTVLPRPPRVRSEKVDKAVSTVLARISITTLIKRVVQQMQEAQATYKSEVLSTLLEDIRGVLDDEHKKRIDDVLKEFDNDKPPPSPSVHTKSCNTQSMTSSSTKMDCDRQAFDDAHVSSSVGSNEDLAFLEEDVLGDLGSIETGRNSQI